MSDITLKNTDTAVNAVRYAVKARGAWEKFVTENGVTRDQIAEVARMLAALAYPTDKPVQKIDGTRTRFGNAVQAAGNGMRSVLDKTSDPIPTDYLANFVKAATSANKHGVSTQAMLDALHKIVNSTPLTAVENAA